MAILFAILKTILKLLLIILALVIILILLVFFVPFRYKVASVKSPDTIEAVATVTWLLRMLTVEKKKGKNGDRKRERSSNV